jgi:hypothetical protein
MSQSPALHAADSHELIRVQGFMATLARPEVDLLEGLTTAIIVDQERMGSGAGGNPIPHRRAPRGYVGA